MTNTETEVTDNEGDENVTDSNTGVEDDTVAATDETAENTESDDDADNTDEGDETSKPEFEEVVDVSDVELDELQQTKANLRVDSLLKQGFDEGMANYIAKIEQHNLAMRFAEKTDSARVLDQIAEILDIEVDQFIQSADQWAFDVRVEKELEKAEYQNIEPELARKMATSEIRRIQAERKIAAEQAANDKEAQANKAIDDLFAEFPEAMKLNPLPKEITGLLQKGYTPREAYLKYRLDQEQLQKQTEEKAKKDAEAAASKSPGSSKSQKETDDGDPLAVLSKQLFSKE